ncbi:hypothetical protein R3P38DRAFT_3003372 [Favolaschia claudopus]|uniref:Uncharacterized protein n=1 Tax=Favolaschia claudopus TaxID=2862362 RepID=A0AAW0ANY4_9AGAR
MCDGGDCGNCFECCCAVCECCCDSSNSGTGDGECSVYSCWYGMRCLEDVADCFRACFFPNTVTRGQSQTSPSPHPHLREASSASTARLLPYPPNIMPTTHTHPSPAAINLDFTDDDETRRISQPQLPPPPAYTPQNSIPIPSSLRVLHSHPYSLRPGVILDASTSSLNLDAIYPNHNQEDAQNRRHEPEPDSGLLVQKGPPSVMTSFGDS